MRGVSTQVQMIVVSVNYRTTPIELREQVSFQQGELLEAMQALQKMQSIVENVIISTCNRTEIYAVVAQYESGLQALKQFLATWFTVPLATFDHHLLVYKDDQAVHHLFRVSTGIDSMVIGETQILGQVRTSFLQGQSIGTTGTIFNELFNRAIAFSKRAHVETNIGKSAVSISYAAVQLLKQVVGELSERQVLVVGAGEMGELTIKNLKGSGVQDISIVNRTFATAEEVALRYGIAVKSMDLLQDALKTVDIVISSTGAMEPVLQSQVVQQIMASRQDHSLYCVDIGVPRDIDACVREIPSVYLYDIDDIQQIVDANLAEREAAANKVAAMIGEQIISFNEWLATLAVVPTITALQKKGKQIQQETMISIVHKIPNLTEREQNVLALHTQSIVNQLLREPIQEVKMLAFDSNDEALTSFQRTFGIEEVKRNQEREMIAKLARERLK